MKSRVIVAGGGVAGLSAAYTLGREGFEVVLLEAAPKLGGKVQTVREDGMLVELGPDSVFTIKPWAVSLMQELGMEDEFVEPCGHDFSILVGGKLHHVPRALATLMPSASGVLEKVAFLSAAAKRRVLAEREAPTGSGDDESIASFFRRRFGRKFSETVAEPLLAGIHAGDPEQLSMKALYPTYLGMEQKHGSLSNVQAPPPPKTGRKPGFLTLRDGMGSLIERLTASLENVDLRVSTQVREISEQGRKVHLDGGEVLEADHLVMALPASGAAGLLRQAAPEAAEALATIRYVSTALVTLAYDDRKFEGGRFGNGFLVPNSEPSDVTGCTMTSTKWPGRAPEGVALLRVFMGRAGGLDVEAFSDEELIRRAVDAVAGATRTRVEPHYRRLDRWHRAMPQYLIGHLDLMEQVDRALEGWPLVLAGSSYRGSGIPDCVRQGREAAAAILEGRR